MKYYQVKAKCLIAIVGPTASGKTELALRLARKLKGAIISADSRQIYQKLPIGTNQPAGRWLIANSKWQKIFGKKKIYFVKNIPHFFIACKKPNQSYSVAQFQKEVNKLLKKLSRLPASRFQLPILVGGTGLYVSSVVEGYQLPPGRPDFKLRKKLDKLSNKELLARIKKLDHLTYKRIDKKNHRRLVRALEYVLTTGQSFFKAQQKNPLPNSLIIGLSIPRPQLYLQINRRVDQMMKRGLLKEVRWLVKKYPNSPALKTIGYQELVPVIKKGADLNQAVELIKQHTRNFAKRQITWFKRMPQVTWVKNYQQATRIINKFLY